MSTYLFIDGENFLHKVEEALREQGIPKRKVDTSHIDVASLITLAIPDYTLEKKYFYSAKLKLFRDWMADYLAR